MNRFAGLILALSISAVLGACASTGASGGAGAATAESRGTRPSDNKSTREASRAIGLAMLKSGEEQRALFEQALQGALASIESEPGNPKGWFLAGQAYANLGDYANADSAFTQAVTIYPDYAQEVDAERENAWVMAFNAAIEAYQVDDIPGAITKLEGADRIFQKRPEARLNLAAFYAQEDQIDKAIDAYRGALEIIRGPMPEGLDDAGREEWVSNEEMAALNLASLLSSTERFAEAEQVYRELIERQADNLTAHAGLAEVLAQQGKSDEAGEVYNELLSRPDLTDSHFLTIGVGLFRSDDFEGAANAFRMATEKNPYSRDAYYNLAQSLYMSVGKADDARKAAKGAEAKELDAKLLELNRELGTTTEKVLEFDPFNRDLLLFLARSYQSQGQLAANARERQQFQSKVQDLLTRYEEFPVEVNDISIRTGDEEIQVSGLVKNLKVKEGEAIRLAFSVFSSTGAVIGREEVTITAPMAETSTNFQVTIPVEGEFAGWKYERVN